MFFLRRPRRRGVRPPSASPPRASLDSAPDDGHRSSGRPPPPAPSPRQPSSAGLASSQRASSRSASVKDCGGKQRGFRPAGPAHRSAWEWSGGERMRLSQWRGASVRSRATTRAHRRPVDRMAYVAGAHHVAAAGAPKKTPIGQPYARRRRPDTPGRPGQTVPRVVSARRAPISAGRRTPLGRLTGGPAAP